MFNEIFGDYNADKIDFKEEIRIKLALFYPRDTVRAERIRWRDSFFFFGPFQQTGGPDFKKFVNSDLKEVFENTGRSIINVLGLEYEEGELTIDEINWSRL